MENKHWANMSLHPPPMHLLLLRHPPPATRHRAHPCALSPSRKSAAMVCCDAILHWVHVNTERRTSTHVIAPNAGSEHCMGDPACFNVLIYGNVLGEAGKCISEEI